MDLRATLSEEKTKTYKICNFCITLCLITFSIVNMDQKSTDTIGTNHMLLLKLY